MGSIPDLFRLREGEVEEVEYDAKPNAVEVKKSSEVLDRNQLYRKYLEEKRKRRRADKRKRFPQLKEQFETDNLQELKDSFSEVPSLNPEELVYRKELNSILRNALLDKELLSPRQRAVLYDYFLNGLDILTLSQKYATNEKQIQINLNNGLEELKHSKYFMALRKRSDKTK
jgi:DNA-directed RNA polymerase specialized sigma24 family protein